MPRTNKRLASRTSSSRSISSASRHEPPAQPSLPLAPRTLTGARKNRGPSAGMTRSKRLNLLLIGLTAAVLIANALVGERGLVRTVQIRKSRQQLADSIAQLRQENAQLTVQAKRLREVPSAIETLARDELGLIRPGEQLFIVTDRRRADDGSVARASAAW